MWLICSSISAGRACDDGSICGHSPDDSCYTQEIVSGVLRGKEGAAELFQALRAIKDLQPSVNASTGTHVHVSVCVDDGERCCAHKPARSWCMQMPKIRAW